MKKDELSMCMPW